MAEIRCEECGSIIPNGAKACPNCGCPIVEENTLGKLSKNFYTKDEDPYVDLAAKLTAVPKVVTVVTYILYTLFNVIILVLIRGVSSTFGAGWFPFIIFGAGLLPFFIAYTLIFGVGYLFWWWVGNIIVNGVRKIRQSK